MYKIRLDREKMQRSFVTFSCLLLCSCSLTPSASIVQSEPPQQPIERIQKKQVEEPLDPMILTLLQRGHNIVKPFAWGTWDENGEKGQIIGIDREDELRSFTFVKTPEGYTMRKTEMAHGLSRLIRSSGSLDIKDYITDREFPFKSDIATVETGRVHFIVVWKALNRSLQKTSLLKKVAIRIITEKHPLVLSNEIKDVGFLGVHQSFIKDINADGKQEYIIFGNDNYANIHIWTVESDCTVKPIYFKEDEELTESVPGREIFLKLDKSNGRYAIHRRMFDLVVKNGQGYWEVTESIYKWDNQESVYRMVKEVVRFEKAD